MKNVLFYSSVKDKSLFQTQKFYQTDIIILKRLGYNVILSNRITDAFRFWRYDLVFGYFFRYSFFVALIARIFGRRTYLTGGIDALDIDYAGKKKYEIQKLLFLLCYLVAYKCIIVSKEDLKHVEEIVGQRKCKIVFSEHSIDTSLFKGELDFYKRENNFITIGWQGSKDNVHRKGIDKAIKLFSYLSRQKEFEESKFYILGRAGEGTQFLNELSEKYNVGDSVVLLGEVSEEEKIAYLKTNRFYFQLSEYEGFGIAALEALIAGAVVLHSGKGGLKNLIYEKHILVDVDMFNQESFADVYRKINNLDFDKVKESALYAIAYYDNSRRLEEFREIMNKE